MAKKDVVLEEFHLTVLVPRDLGDREIHAIRRTLANQRFQPKFVRAIRQLFDTYPSLGRVRLKLSQ
jgi:hypothetical protein